MRTLEEQFVELLRQLVPSPEWLELLKQTVLSIWHEELGQASDVRETTYEELRDKLREELTLAELELSEAKVEQFDIDSALAKAISVLNQRRLRARPSTTSRRSSALEHHV